MGKRKGGLRQKTELKSHKTKKRLEKKHKMLDERKISNKHITQHKGS